MPAFAVKLPVRSNLSMLLIEGCANLFKNEIEDIDLTQASP